MKLISLLIIAVSSLPLSGIKGKEDLEIIPESSKSGFPYFGCDFVLKSNEQFGPIYYGDTSYSGSLYFDADTTVLNHEAYIEIGKCDNPNTYSTNEFYFLDSFIPQNGRNTISFTLTFNNGFNYQNEIPLYFGIYLNNGSYICRGLYYIKACPKTININNLTSDILVLKGYSFKLGEKQSIYEYLDFSSFDSYFTNDRYYRLLIDFLAIRYPNYESFKAGEIGLRIKDTDSLFPKLFNPKFQYPFIPLKFEKIDGIYQIKYANIMYVNPNSLEMSLEKIDGFQECSHFYLPRGKAELFNGYEFVLEMYNVGLHNINFTYELTFEVGYNIIGDCITSDYCIVGGIRD